MPAVEVPAVEVSAVEVSAVEVDTQRRLCYNLRTSMTTTIPNIKTLERSWLLIDAENRTLGRLASRIALILRGKHKPTFTPFLDTGDFVIVINAAKLAVTGKKTEQKTYKRYSGYPGGLRSRTLERVMELHPDRVLRQAVKGMLPKGPLGRHVLSNLKIYPGAAHPHTAQQPQPVNAVLFRAKRAEGSHG